MNDVKKLVGFKRFTSKNGKEYCVANVTSGYSVTDKNCYGLKVEELFLPDHCVNLLNEKCLGKDIEVAYRICNGRAYLEDIKVI